MIHPSRHPHADSGCRSPHSPSPNGTSPNGVPVKGVPANRRSTQGSAANGRLAVRTLVERLTQNVFGTHDPAREAIVSLHRVSSIHREAGNEIFSRFGLAPAAAEVLITLRTFEPPYRRTPSELAAAILISPGGLSKLLPDLEGRGLVLRRRNPEDRRSVTIELTDGGFDLASEIFAALVGRDRSMLAAALSPEQIETLAELLRIILLHEEA